MAYSAQSVCEKPESIEEANVIHDKYKEESKQEADGVETFTDAKAASDFMTSMFTVIVKRSLFRDISSAKPKEQGNAHRT